MFTHRLLITMACTAALAAAQNKGILLEDLTWQQAEKVLTPETIVVIPIGAESKEHGPHLELKNDWLMAEWLKKQVLKQSNVVVAPTVNYHYYPAFVEYPGSTTLRLETARDLMVDICKSLARYGPKKFYVLNTGVSTARPLRMSAELLAKDEITMRFTDLSKVNAATEKQVQKEEGGTHADELETSMMLVIAPETVDMTKAVKDYHPSGRGGLSRSPNGPGDYSASGIFGDPTLASREKGEILLRGLMDGILKDIEDLRSSR